MELTMFGKAAAGAVLSVALLLPVAGLRAQTASVSGTVLIDSIEKPLANAEIMLTDLNRTTRSDSAGRFILAGLPAGKHSLVIRFVGFETYSADLALRATDKFEADFLLRPQNTKLATVKVEDAAPSPYAAKLAEFEERRLLGSGRFVTADAIQKEAGRPLSSFLAKTIPGVRFTQERGKKYFISSRGTQTFMNPTTRPKPSPGSQSYPPGCYLQVILNGRVEYNGSAGQEPFDVDRLNSQDVIGLEYYTTATTPLKFNGSGASACGTVVIWTKAG